MAHSGIPRSEEDEKIDQQVDSLEREQIVLLGRCLWKDPGDVQRYLKGLDKVSAKVKASKMDSKNNSNALPPIPINENNSNALPSIPIEPSPKSPKMSLTLSWSFQPSYSFFQTLHWLGVGAVDRSGVQRLPSTAPSSRSRLIPGT